MQKLEMTFSVHRRWYVKPCFVMVVIFEAIGAMFITLAQSIADAASKGVIVVEHMRQGESK